ncbi:transcriptional regulator [Streptococcus caviae]|uniref:hypothetical protein n=1 Tax=Streptococcus sp. 'caviae' TaxID=1915004 RepID=UPI00094B9720|nr:hypothetical protein [Streptococcus sp. 'caviae']OLN84707.1 hypothetical protein BMI76_01110 [Streptococcus sp. 'caviae']
MFSSYFLIIMLFLFMMVLTAATIIQELIRAGKWIGLGAILGNAVNNKINANAAHKSGRIFKKKRVNTGNKMADRLANFISPSNEEDEPDGQVKETVLSDDYADFQEYLKWKKWKSSQESDDRIND